MKTIIEHNNIAFSGPREYRRRRMGIPWKVVSAKKISKRSVMVELRPGVHLVFDYQFSHYQFSTFNSSPSLAHNHQRGFLCLFISSFNLTTKILSLTSKKISLFVDHHRLTILQRLSPVFDILHIISFFYFIFSLPYFSGQYLFSS